MWCVSSSPLWVQVVPPSVETYTPLPQELLWRFAGSPVPTHTTDGSEGATAREPIEDTSSFWNCGIQVIPWFSVFQTPAEAVPTQNTFGSDSTTAMSSMRPPMIAGPMFRHSILFRMDSTCSAVWEAAGAASSSNAHDNRNGLRAPEALRRPFNGRNIVSPPSPRGYWHRRTGGQRAYTTCSGTSGWNPGSRGRRVGGPIRSARRR